MTIENLRRVARAQPFKPFTISLTDGRRFYVAHPECLALPPQASRTFIGAKSDEEYNIVDLLGVTSLVFGRRKPRRRGGNASRG